MGERREGDECMKGVKGKKKVDEWLRFKRNHSSLHFNCSVTSMLTLSGCHVTTKIRVLVE